MHLRPHRWRGLSLVVRRSLSAILLVGVLLVGVLTSCGEKDPGPPAGPAAADLALVGVPPASQRVRIVRHTDGDTLRVVPVGPGPLERGVEIRVRLLEIDAPESVDPDSPVECYGRTASRALARLLPTGATAWALPDRELLDRYGRTLLYLWTADGLFVNEALVRRGFARAVFYPPNDRYIDQMRDAEAEAQEGGVGLWGHCAA